MLIFSFLAEHGRSTGKIQTLPDALAPSLFS